jgi:hypothetical protein
VVESRDKESFMTRVRKRPYVLMVFFLVLLILGINLDEVPEVLQNAVNLCLSCIGIG